MPLFLPWALLPWDVAWIVWRGINVLLLVWSASWAYQRHPLATAILLCILAAPIAATLDTGNLTLLCSLGVWAAQFTGPRLGGGLWALATVLKWFPAPLWLILPARARLWGLVWIGVAGILALATWPETWAQIRTAIAFPRPFRLDYLLLLWAAVPWIWAHDRLLEPAKQAAQEMGEQLKPAAQEAVESVKATAQEAAATVKDESQSAVQDVQGQAQASKDKVQSQAGSSPTTSTTY